MKTVFNLLLVCLLVCASNNFAEAQSNCSAGHLNIGVTSHEHSLHDPLQFPDAYVLVRIGMYAHDDVDIGSPILSQNYPHGSQTIGH